MVQECMDAFGREFGHRGAKPRSYLPQTVEWLTIVMHVSRSKLWGLGENLLLPANII